MAPSLPKVIIHGGAGTALHDQGGLGAVRADLHRIVEQVYQRAQDGAPAVECVVLGCQLLEDTPRFNAGHGSVLQSDGQVRMSAALMDGATQRFSGVINVSRVQHPIDLATFLQPAADRVLSDLGAMELARELAIPLFDPVTDLRLREWMQERANHFQSPMAGVVAEPTPGDTNARRGTIGVVVLDTAGQLAAGTSTGGKGLERIGRVSDSAMPAGNYANGLAAISCTGIGEDIIDECLAARIVVRVTDGMSIEAAFVKSFAEATANQRDFGAIGLSHLGEIAWGKTSDMLLAAYHTGSTLGDTLDLPAGTQTGVISP
ncbi:MAG TPA: isoaspartyl peptidase/L-asparaginase [Leptolyngbyaceae cyanobacterium M65_K2018_010]|nr:isoaspartyl peptidase/L-asparaginase [Leptolyngbyaceae cyanobacterium M65_K2018_010]